MEANMRFSAVVCRLRRRLAKDGIRLVKTRGGAANRWYSDLGEWHTVDANNCTAGYVDPVAMAREMGVLLPDEVVADGQGAMATA